MLSSPSSSSSSSISPQKYEVFLSFSGKDTRETFTDHLHAALKRIGIVTFRDDLKLEAGEEIAPGLLKAIQESWCSLIVFSKTYTSSSWCLKELAEIVKQRKDKGHRIFPIFYHVDPSDLRKQTGVVAEDFAKHEERYKDKIQRWREALTEVANLKGWHLENKHESEFIRSIVEEISIKLSLTYLDLPDGLTGINSRLKELHSKIDIRDDDDVRIIGICGMGGLGKTTLAKVVYSQMSHKFEGKSFLANYREVSEEHRVVSLQKQLLADILGEDFKLFNSVDGIAMIRRRLSCKKVLVVIDDVDSFEPLKCLVGSRDWFGPGSRIIITTRNEHLLRAHKMDPFFSGKVGVDDVYEPATLNSHEAHELFNLKAFNTDTVPENDFEELSLQVVKYAGGLPLALEVLGSFLCGRDASQWRSAIERLKREPEEEILGRLRIGFDGLRETEKNIFLDIACFFNMEKKDFVVKILDGCEFFPETGIDVLIEKSLIKVVDNKYLRMHDLLQEMGRQIVKQKSPEPGKRCRLWEQKEVYDVLKGNTATETIEGIVINKYNAGEPMYMEQDKMYTLIADALLKMKKLRLLRVSTYFYKQKSRVDLKYLPNDLRLLDWKGYPLRSLPSSFQSNNLVALLITDSHIERLWEENSPLPKLKLVDLQGSKDLIETPDFTRAPNLESLILEGCTRIVDVRLGDQSKLKLLNLRGCKSLKRLSTKRMDSLETLILSGCSNLQRFLGVISEMKNLQEIYVDETHIEELPPMTHLSKLKSLSLRDCKSLRSLPIEIIEMESLEYLILSGCSNLQKFPESDKEMKCLQRLYLDGTGIEELHSSIGHLSKLKSLSLRNCKSLRSLPIEIIEMESLEYLILSGCSNLQKFPESDKEMKCLQELYLDGTGIKELPSSIRHLSDLILLNLKDCSNLVSLPTKLEMKSLKTLVLSGCSNLQRFPEIAGEMRCLQELDLDGTGIEELPSSIGHLSKLKSLSLRDCKSLRSLPIEITEMESLEYLILSGCSNLQKFPESDKEMKCLQGLHLDGTGIEELPSSIGHLSKLKRLSLIGCKSLRSLPIEITEMESLEYLILSGCSNLQKFPESDKEMKCLQGLHLDGTGIEELPYSIGHLSKLKRLSLIGCKSLRSLPIEITEMESLEYLILSGCSNLQKFPESDKEMKCLQELDLDGTGIEELHSSIGHLSKLKSLSLRDCKSLRSLPIEIIEMESLEYLTFSGCSKLQKFPESDKEMKCLQRLYLDGTGIEELPSSIGHLSNLRLLNLKDCSNIVSLPSSIDGCKFLRTLILSGCSKVETLPENLLQAEFLGELDLSGTAIRKSLVLHSLSALSSLYKLNLSDCNLEEGYISSDIACLSSLKELYLGGNNFSSLPATLGELPKLYRLDLVNCRNLKSLPKIRSPTRQVYVDGCASLVEDPIIVCCDWGGVTIRGVNCYKLVEKNNALTMLRKQIKVLRNETRQIEILVPGSEIPEWFSHQTDGSSMNIALPPNIDNDSRWVGIAFCCLVVYAFNGEDDDDDGHAFWNDVESYGRFNQGRFFYLDNKRQRVKKDHLWIHYISRDCWEKKDWKGNNGYSQIIEYSTGARLYYKVKKCAAQIVYEEDLDEMEWWCPCKAMEKILNFICGRNINSG